MLIVVLIEGLIFVSIMTFSIKDKCEEMNRMYVKAYIDACHMSDLIRCYKDHLTSDSLIQDYGCFEELEQQFLNEDGKVNLANYSFCY